MRLEEKNAVKFAVLRLQTAPIKQILIVIKKKKSQLQLCLENSHFLLANFE